MYVYPIIIRRCSSSTMFVKSCINIRRPLPRAINLKQLKCLKIGHRIGDTKGIRTSCRNQFISYSCNMTVFSAMCSSLPKDLSHILNQTSQNVEYNMDINCKYQSKGITYLLRRMLWNIWEFFLISVRILELACVFIPFFMLYPFTRFSSRMKTFWYRVLLYDLEFCGPIFIKLGQWASTRRDLFPEELCTCLSRLQRKTKPHSWFYTECCLEKAYGPQWKQIFVQFDNNFTPIGSGCCAQVYKVWIDPRALSLLKQPDAGHDYSRDSVLLEGVERFGLSLFLGKNPGKYSKRDLKEVEEYSRELIPVALKVRHPRMEIMLRRDLAVLKAMASIVTTLIPSLKWLSLVDCVEDFAQLMKSQVDLCVEAHNLEKFSANFKNTDSVKFPSPIWSLTRSNILVETYEEGRLMQNYVMDKSANSINLKLAEIGINAILKMVFEDNFVHGDLHPGNMLVQEKDTCGLNMEKSRGFFPFSFSSKPSPFPMNLVILDCGITASLDDRGKKCLKNVFAAVAEGDGERVGELFLIHSSHQCSDPESFKSKMKEIVSAALDKSITLEQVEVSSLLSSLFSAMIDHKVKLDGTFSSIMLAIMVLEGLGRSLDPTVDIVEKAKPFLLSSM